jgi:hypothetical protein
MSALSPKQLDDLREALVLDLDNTRRACGNAMDCFDMRLDPGGEYLVRVACVALDHAVQVLGTLKKLSISRQEAA